ncbi:13719_t:CDS:2 [Entrophospora sp. SA101]|nr:13719_t:CDS:2 [Entrophospora sp. SA101]
MCLGTSEFYDTGDPTHTALNSSKSKRQISEPIDTTKDFDSTVIALGTPKHYAESTIRSKQIIVEMRQDVIVDAREFDDNDGARTPFRPFSPASHSLSSSSLNNYPNKSLKNNRQQNNNGKNNNDDNITIATATTPRSSNYSNATTPRSSNYSNTATRLSNYNNNDYGVRLGGGKFNHTIHGSSGLSQEHSIIKEESEYNNCNDTSSSIYSSDIRIGSNLQSTVGDNIKNIHHAIPRICFIRSSFINCIGFNALTTGLLNVTSSPPSGGDHV